MNTMLGKYGLWIFGGLLGGGAGYIFAKRFLESKKETAKQLELDFDGVKNTEEMTATDIAKNIVQNAIESEKEDEYWDGTKKTNEEDVVVTDEKKMKKKDKTHRITDYAALSKKPLKDVAKEQLGDEEETTNKDLTVPYIISLEEHALNNGHDKVVLTYYDHDDILCDESDKVLTDHDKLIGPDGLVKFGQDSGDPDSVYIRNVNLATDFEVVRLHKSYSQEVLGIDPEPAKKRPPSRKTVKKKVIDDDEEG